MLTNAVIVQPFGGPEVLQLASVDPPPLRPGCARVAIHATALNRADLLQRQGHYPAPEGESDILGLEMAGVVSEIAQDVPEATGLRVGDRVMALLPGGGYADEAVVPVGLLMPVPETLTLVEAAAIPEVFLTAYSNLVWLGSMHADDRVLIHAGASGVGTAAIQLVRVLGGRSIVTAGSAEKRIFCEQLGAEKAIDYHAGSFVPDVLSWSQNAGVHLIFDFVGAPYLDQNLRCLATDGRLIIIGTMGGRMAEQLDLGLLLSRRLQVIGTALRSRTLLQKTALTREFADFALPLFAGGELRPIVDKVFALEDVRAAHAYMESNGNIGKIVLQVRA
ncbi:MAG: NAD(P)H-quinone oxidoreductase [Firmicutes bacterium]|nr:NAD(P)H-quinone oxidoreductase [Bacillota bacterium]